MHQVISTTPPEAIREILIIDQARTEEPRLIIEKMDERIQCSSILKSERHFYAVGHDHAAVLNGTIPQAFDEGLFTRGIDTGRTIVTQLLTRGAKVALVQPSVGFSGCRGGQPILNVVITKYQAVFMLEPINLHLKLAVCITILLASF